MRIEKQKYGQKTFDIVCGHIFPIEDLQVGTNWISSCGSICELTNINYETEEVTYIIQNGYDIGRSFERDYWNFQVRYCLIKV